MRELVYPALMLTMAAYFAVIALRGSDGLYRQLEIEAVLDALRVERDGVAAEVTTLRNRTKRLSDGFLDIDLLDQQARDVLGYLRTDEIVIR